MAGDDYDYDGAVRSAYERSLPFVGRGKVADYIPELAGVDPSQFGVCLCTVDGRTFSEGDTRVPFSIQSISKVIVLMMVMPRVEEGFRRVHVEPSGDPFNSLVQLEYEHGIPRNPFINAGALVTTDYLIGLEPEPEGAILDFLGQLTDSRVQINEQVARSELSTASRNRALAYLMKSFGNLESDVERILDVYCHHCAIEMTLEDLARTFLVLANRGVSPVTGTPLLTPLDVKRINALMMTCGFYDESGEFAFRVGLPGKSGVGGGVITVHPGRFSLATWSPGLNAKGNSMVGMKALEIFTSSTGLSLF